MWFAVGKDHSSIYDIRMVGLVHRTKHVDGTFEKWTIWNPNLKKFGIQMNERMNELFIISLA